MMLVLKICIFASFVYIICFPCKAIFYKIKTSDLKKDFFFLFFNKIPFYFKVIFDKHTLTSESYIPVYNIKYLLF